MTREEGNEMRQQWIGMAAAALLLGSAGSALALQEQQGSSAQGTSQSQQSGQQTSASKGEKGSKQMSAQAEHRLTGKVTAIKGDTLYLTDRNDAVVPLKVTQNTEVQGKPLQKSESINRQISRDFPVGEEVRASFRVEGETDNVAVRLDAAGMRHQGSQQGSQSQQSENPSQTK